MGRRAIANAVAGALLQLGRDEPHTSTMRYLGIVEQGRFTVLAPEAARGEKLRLTRIAMQVAQRPESAELQLEQIEGRIAVVDGYNGGGWLYSSNVIWEAGPLLSRLLRWAFG